MRNLSRDRLIQLSRLSGWIIILGWWWSTRQEPSRFTLQEVPLAFFLLLPLAIPYAQWLWYRLTTHAHPDPFNTVPQYTAIQGLQLRHKPHVPTTNIAARGTRWHPLFVLSGSLDHLNPAQRQAIFWHEWAHLKYWDLSLNILIFLGVAALTHHMLLSVLALRAYSRYSEFRADQESLHHTDPNVLASALDTLDPKRIGDWLECVPIINLIFTHPSTASRIQAIAQHPKELTV